MDELNIPVTKRSFERRSGDSLVQVIAHKLESLHGDVGDMRTILRELTTAVTKLAVIEERQGQASIALERAFKEIEKVTARCDAHVGAIAASIKTLEARTAFLELAAPTTKQTSAWVTSFLVGAAVLAFLMVAKQVGLA